MPKTIPNDDKLQTLITKVEAVVNSRPLIDVRVEAGQSFHLVTANHLLRLNSGTVSPLIDSNEFNNYSRQRFKITQFAADEFWKKWVAEYVKTIQLREKWHQNVET